MDPIQAQIQMIANWKQIAAFLDSKPLRDLIEGYEAALRQIEAGKERLAKAMERETKLKEDAAKVPALEKQIEAMLDHPDVRAAKRAKLAAEINRLQAEADKIKPEEKKPD